MHVEAREHSQVPATFFEISLELVRSGRLADKPQGCTSFHVPRAGVTSVPRHTQIFMWVLKIELTCSHLHGNHMTKLPPWFLEFCDLSFSVLSLLKDPTLPRSKPAKIQAKKTKSRGKQDRGESHG